MKLSKVEDRKNPANLHRTLTLEMVRVTERAAIAAAEWRGKGNERAADDAAVAAMKAELDRVAISGRIVIGEGEQYECDDLYVGQPVGEGEGPAVDIAVDPLEGVTLCAKNQPDSLVVLAMAERGGLLNVARNVYMHKIAIGAGYAPDTVHVEWSATENVTSLAKAKGVPVSEITAVVLDRPRHAGLIEELRVAGVSVKLLSDGDIAGVIHAVNTEDTGIDIYLGSGGAPEGVLAAAALRCIGGHMQGKLILDTPDKRLRAKEMGIEDPHRIYQVTDLASGDVLFSATGITDGSLVDGVKLRRSTVDTSTVVMRSWSQTTRWIRARHAR
ncbi:class II fructose-bisphosphatase [Devosia sp. 63-57]|uniref:class II fructose-bisphosphatase n=1 Tax=Devosia sp. 63-57 TaxID=1895751 RepID=UPI00086DECF2|nr:class II fructose-bisphosphatase [Devosia sp. 63-57]ODT49146.1 MAG: fructose-bisphosphatase, class II [Pelagibacterium sp. SCN 63-126]ODU86068.1 MAG: fructose-bisphosphatase, class II [Pelagibacterium sp. SCN 63-17]OJX43336.1 MAG: fructose-bisphosphatase, class II [Devosia sp. 63-57]